MPRRGQNVIDLGLRLSRIDRFGRLIRRFDLVSFRSVADELAREPGSVDRNETRRAQAYRDLGESILRGEFGQKQRGKYAFASVLRMPEFPESGGGKGRFPLRVSLTQVAYLLANQSDPSIEFVGTTRYAEIGDFWALRAMMAMTAAPTP